MPVNTTTVVRTAAFVVGLALPTLTLVPLGGLWLWERGYALPWAVAAALVVASMYLVQRRVLSWRSPERHPAEPNESLQQPGAATAPDPGWSPAETNAWSEVVRMALAVEPAGLSTRDDVVDLGERTLRVVATRLNPGSSDPQWQFTLPEAFAILERVSRRLGLFVTETVPLSDRMTVAHALGIYRWRGAIDVAERAYDVWRLVRLANPVTAATQEMRERLTRHMYQWGRNHVIRRLAEAYVLEVGRAAIDLYGGRLRVPQAALSAHMTDVSRADLAAAPETVAEPLRILVVEPASSGGTRLSTALRRSKNAVLQANGATENVTTLKAEQEGLPWALLIEAPGPGGDGFDVDALLERTGNSDLILWVHAIDSSDLSLDRAVLQRLREHFASRGDRHPSPVLLVVTAGGLIPVDRSDLDRLSAKLAVDLAAGVVVWIDEPRDDANSLHELWQQIRELLPQARRSQMSRLQKDARSKPVWSRLWGQTLRAGQTVAGSLLRRK
jgi:hypothetical protein